MKKKLVVLTGAGMSAESGIATFRGGDGLWENYRIQDVATPEAWQRDPELVQRFYNERRKQVLKAAPNPGHILLAKLEQYFEVHVITQNIDDLHERGGSSRVLHLHGEITKSCSVSNRMEIYPIDGWELKMSDRDRNGQPLRPFIVWFGEPVPMLETASKICSTADFFMVVGTSLQVYPAAGLVFDVPLHAACAVIDPHIPEMQGMQRFVAVRKGASEGLLHWAQQTIPGFK